MDEPIQNTLFSEQDLADEQGDGRIVINSRCQLLMSGEDRIVMVLGVVLAYYRKGDRVSEAHAMVSLVAMGHAKQNEVALAFGCSDRSVRRYKEHFAASGLAALGRPSGYPAGKPRLKESRVREIEQLKAEGLSNRAIAARMGVDEKAIRKQLKRLGWKSRESVLPGLEEGKSTDSKPPEEQEALSTEGSASPCMTPCSVSDDVAKAADPNTPIQAEESPKGTTSFSLDTDPLHRVNDRLLASQGLITDAMPIFASGKAIPGGGVLLAVPIILASGVLDCATDIYGSLGPAFHGLRTTIMTFLLMALLRIKRPEGLKECSPCTLGRILGLDRIMEVKTLRGKLAKLASSGRATEFGRVVAKRHIEAHGEDLGFLYVDGHVRVYSGKQEIPKAHVTRLRISLPATTDYFLNDEHGDPLFVVTAPANAGLTKMLSPVMDEAKSLIPGRRLTVVFDRGGYCYDLFKKLIADDVDILTYRKGPHVPVAKENFHACPIKIKGKDLTYQLADGEVILCEGLTLRQITRLCENGHQTTILTSRRDLDAAEVAFRMFERWRQENFFKYMRQEFALDALVDYDTEPDDVMRDVPNPVWRGLDAQLRKARTELEKLCAIFGLNIILDKENLRGILKPLKTKKTANTSTEGAFIEAEGEVRKLSVERKHLTDVLKMAAYRAESDLFRMLHPFYARNEDEGRTLIQSAFSSAADLEVTDTELKVTLAPLSSPHRSKAIAKLCQELNKTPVCYPGTKLILRYAVAEQDMETGQL